MSDSLSLFIRPADLQAVMNDPDVQIVAVDSRDDFTTAHIPGAAQIAMADIMGSEGATGGLLPSEETLNNLFSNAGLRPDAHIVAYDRAGDGQAARLLYTLDAMGHSRISLLDGGLAAWHAEQRPLASGEPDTPASRFPVERQPQRIADRAWVAEHLADRDTTLLDVRSAAEYDGDDVRAARGGHIPGAVNLDWQHLKDANGQLKPRAELEALLAQQDIQPDQEVAAYCQTHVRSSYVYLVLKYLGYDKVRGYPGAWSDWGNRDDTPIE